MENALPSKAALVLRSSTPLTDARNGGKVNASSALPMSIIPSVKKGCANADCLFVY